MHGGRGVQAVGAIVTTALQVVALVLGAAVAFLAWFVVCTVACALFENWMETRRSRRGRHR